MSTKAAPAKPTTPKRAADLLSGCTSRFTVGEWETLQRCDAELEVIGRVRAKYGSEKPAHEAYTAWLEQQVDHMLDGQNFALVSRKEFESSAPVIRQSLKRRAAEIRKPTEPILRDWLRRCSHLCDRLLASEKRALGERAERLGRGDLVESDPFIREVEARQAAFVAADKHTGEGLAALLENLALGPEEVRPSGV